MKRFSSLALLLVFAVFAAGCDDNDTFVAPGPGNLVEVAISAGSFETLVAAVGAAGLVDTLSGPGPFTVFAPTDAAFAALEASAPGTIDSLLQPQNQGQLQDILTYHVLSGSFFATDVLAASTLPTLQGQSLNVSASGPSVDNAIIIQTDIEASNGVIHVIDAVLIP